jgi:hypothetical protein
MTEAASRGRRRGGTIGLAYVVTRWLFIDRFPRLHSEFRQAWRCPSSRWRLSLDFRFSSKQ